MPLNKRPQRPTPKKNKAQHAKRKRRAMGPERLAYRIREFSALIGVDPSTGYAIVRSGAIAYSRLPGGTLIVSRAAIDEYLAGNRA